MSNESIVRTKPSEMRQVAQRAADKGPDLGDRVGSLLRVADLGEAKMCETVKKVGTSIKERCLLEQTAYMLSGKNGSAGEHVNQLTDISLARIIEAIILARQPQGVVVEGQVDHQKSVIIEAECQEVNESNKLGEGK